MRKLVHGIRRFQKTLFESQRELFERLVEGQRPETLFITCSDSRIDPCLLTQSPPGELFVMRNAGNIVPPSKWESGGEAATIEYAVGVLKVKDVIICGHSHCGAMTALQQPLDGCSSRSLTPWLRHAEPALLRATRSGTRPLDAASLLRRTTEQNVLLQIQNLRTHPSVIHAESNRQLAIHGWIYEFETGVVCAWNSHSDRFELLAINRAA
jgi:carbonic anhydrase